jgi:hypothetical protein
MATLRLSKGPPCSPGSKRWPCIFKSTEQGFIVARAAAVRVTALRSRGCLDAWYTRSDARVRTASLINKTRRLIRLLCSGETQACCWPAADVKRSANLETSFAPRTSI